MDQSSTSSHPPLAGLEAVRAVARHGSLTAAAGALGLTAGALSRRVAAVEAWLGTSLFERHGRGMAPSPDGQRFLFRIEEAFALIEMAGDPWRKRRGPDVVRLSVLPSFARFWLFDRFEALERGSGPADRLRIDVAVEHRIVDVEAGEADIAIRYGRGNWRGVEARRLMSEYLVPVASRRLADQLGPRPSAADLLAYPLLHDSEATGWRAWLEGEGIRRFRPRPQDRRLEDYGLVLAAAQGGLGIALGRLPFAEAAIEASGLVKLSEDLRGSPLCYHLVTRLRELRPAVLELAARLAMAAG